MIKDILLPEKMTRLPELIMAQDANEHLAPFSLNAIRYILTANR